MVLLDALYLGFLENCFLGVVVWFCLFALYEETSCLSMAGAEGLHLPFPSTPCWAAALVFEPFKFGGSSSEPVTDHALSYQALQVTGHHALTVLKADTQGSWDPATKPVVLPPTLPHFPPYSPISQGELIFRNNSSPLRLCPQLPFALWLCHRQRPHCMEQPGEEQGLPWHSQLWPLCPPLKWGRGDEEGVSSAPAGLGHGSPPRARASRLRPARTRAGEAASAGAQAGSHASGVPLRAAPLIPEPAGLQASNSQLQALLSVPRKQRCVLSFTRLEGRSCQRLRQSYQLLGAGSRWRDGTPDREQTFQGRRGRKSLRAAWPAPSPSHAKMEQAYPPFLVSSTHPKSQEEIFTLG